MKINKERLTACRNFAYKYEIEQAKRLEDRRLQEDMRTMDRIFIYPLVAIAVIGFIVGMFK